jgi:hypothetical protein
LTAALGWVAMSLATERAYARGPDATRFEAWRLRRVLKRFLGAEEIT